MPYSLEKEFQVYLNRFIYFNRFGVPMFSHLTLTLLRLLMLNFIKMCLLANNLP